MYLSSMKLVEPPQLDNKTSHVSIGRSAEPAEVKARHRFELGVISVLGLIFTIVLVAVTFGSTKPIEVASNEAAPQPARASARVTFQEEVSRVVQTFVRHFDGSQPKAEDRATANPMSAPKLRGVVAGPNQTVLLRRGHLPHALYVLGENGYVIISGNQSRLVRLDELYAMAAQASETVAR